MDNLWIKIIFRSNFLFLKQTHTPIRRFVDIRTTILIKLHTHLKFLISYIKFVIKIPEQ